MPYLVKSFRGGNIQVNKDEYNPKRFPVRCHRKKYLFKGCHPITGNVLGIISKLFCLGYGYVPGNFPEWRFEKSDNVPGNFLCYSTNQKNIPFICGSKIPSINRLPNPKKHQDRTWPVTFPIAGLAASLTAALGIAVGAGNPNLTGFFFPLGIAYEGIFSWYQKIICVGSNQSI